MVKSKQLIAPVVLDNATPTTYTVPTGFRATILGCMFVNANASLRTVSVTVNGVNIIAALPIPPTGQQPTILAGVLNGVLNAGDVVSILASAASSVTVWMSGREEVA